MTTEPDKELKRISKREEGLKRRRLYVGLRSDSLRVHPDGRASYERLPEEKEIMGNPWSQPAEDAVFDPDPKQRFAEEGAWAMIVRKLPPIADGIQDFVRVGRIFYLQHVPNTDKFGFSPDGTYKALCRTKCGDVCLWPYEYSVFTAEDVVSLWQEKQLKFNPTNIQPARFNDIVFYARSRGIGLADAMVMALGTIKAPVGWFEPSTKKLARACEEMEQRAHAPWVSRRTIGKPMEIKLEVK